MHVEYSQCYLLKVYNLQVKLPATFPHRSFSVNNQLPDNFMFENNIDSVAINYMTILCSKQKKTG